jgi:predicted nuclease of predicted toxin-antitoxin system
MLLYADEDFAFPVVEELRRLGHDVITTQQDGLAGKQTPDTVILARAHSLGRSVLTYNRADFERLHRQGAAHSGILSATHDSDFAALAARIHNALAGLSPGRWCLRVNRPAHP